MNEPLVHVQIKGLVPTPGGAGLFLEAGGKVATVFIDATVAAAILMAMNGESSPRPSTHELMGACFDGLGVSVTAVVINDVQEETFFARLHLLQENDLGCNVVEVDGRPSDCVALAVRAGAPVYVDRAVWEGCEDVGELFRTMTESEDSDSDPFPGTETE